MSAPNKFNVSSGSPDRPYPTGQRGSFLASTLDRSSSFCKTKENNGSSATQEDAMNFLQCLRFDPKLVAADLKFYQQGDVKRFMSVCLGISPDDSLPVSLKSKLVTYPSLEDLKRVKASLRESSNRARERARLYHDALSAFNKYFPSVPSRKRSRLLSGSALGPSAAKMGMQTDSASVLETEQQKSDDTTKSDVPNKRIRTSLADLKRDSRVNALAKPSGMIDKDSKILRLGNIGAVQSEDQKLSIGVDYWEKSKMKKKRSGIKPDVSSITVSTVNKPFGGYREPKQAMQQRPVKDTRLGISNASHEFRQGIANVAVGPGKSEGSSQQPSSGIRSSMPRSGQDSSNLLRDRRDRPNGSDKERVNLRAINKTHVRDDSSPASPTSSMKLNAAAARAPRSSSSGVRKSSPVLYRPTTPEDLYDISHSSVKFPASIMTNNRKRNTPLARSPSPPVGQWTAQKPHKISRSARRTNFVPIVPTDANSPALDTVCDNTENGSGSIKLMSTDSPRQIKVKNDNFSLTGLSESEDSASALVEIISRENNKKCDEIVDEKSGQNVQKMSALLLSMRKNKLVSGKDLGDGVRRQGRTGRGFSAARSSVPMGVEKRGGAGTAKQLRSTKLGVDNKTESRIGRPPTRKLSDRKAYTRQKNIVVNTGTDSLVGSDDGHGELLAAVKAIINTTHACSSSFWKKMECYFASTSDVYIAYLRQQVNVEPAEPTPLDIDCSGTIPNGNWLIKCERDNTGFTSEDRNGKPETKGNDDITLYQRLLSALISDVDSEDIFCTENGGQIFENGLELDSEFEQNGLYYQSGNFHIKEHTCGKALEKIGHSKVESDIDALLNSRFISNLGPFSNGSVLDHKAVSSLACSEFQYDIMSLDNRILLEIQNIGIFPELVPDMISTEDEEIIEDIQRLEDMHQLQASKKKSLLGDLLKSVMENRQLQEKELEQRTVEKLIETTYANYTTFRGPSASGGKSSNTKLAKKVALDSVRRTVERCQQFEETGKSCFNEPTYMDMLISGIFRVDETNLADTLTEGEALKVYANTTSRALEGNVSVSMDSQQSPLVSRPGQNIDSQDIYTEDIRQTSIKDDIWSYRVKKREILLDNIGGTQNTLIAPSGIRNSLPSSAKGKRSERDRDGKGNTKTGRPSLSNNVKGERKSKAKPKQKTTQLSASINGRLGKISEQPIKSREVGTSKDEFGLDVLEESEPLDLSHLQLPGMDVLGGVHGDLDDQGQDFDSWLDINDDALQDHDSMGLEIPMDDLSDLNMML